MNLGYKHKGLSLIELLVAVSVISIIASSAGPSIVETAKKLKVTGATETSYFLLLQARSAAISNNTNIYVDVNAGANWCMGITDQANCACNTASSCTVDGIEQVISASEFDGISLQNITFTDDDTEFDSIRGMSFGHSGQLEFTNGTDVTRVSLNNLGRVSVCLAEGNVNRFSAC